MKTSTSALRSNFLNNLLTTSFAAIPWDKSSDDLLIAECFQSFKSIFKRLDEIELLDVAKLIGSNSDQSSFIESLVQNCAAIDRDVLAANSLYLLFVSIVVSQYRQDSQVDIVCQKIATAALVFASVLFEDCKEAEAWFQSRADLYFELVRESLENRS